MTPARFRWGTLLITIGLLLLLRNIGLLHDDVWLELLIWLPAVLIAIGIEKIFTKSRLEFLAYLSSVALLVLALMLAFQTSSTAGSDSYFERSSHRIEFDPAVAAIKADLDLNNTNLTIRDSGDDLVYGEFDRFTRKPQTDFRIDNDTAYVSYRARSGSYLGGAIKINVSDEQEWELQFSDLAPLDLSLTAKESDLHMALATTPLYRLDVDAEGAAIYLKLGDMEPQVKVRIRGRDASLKLRLPHDLGLLVRGEEYASYLSRLGLEPNSGDFITIDYQDAPSQVELDIDEELSSFTLEFF